MSSKIVIVDYGMGNLHSVNKAIAVVGGDPVISSDAVVIAQADKLILPGVGAFGDCMANLQRSGLVPILQKYLHSGRPFLGICLGMQVLFEGSDEAPGVKGLGYFQGQVRRLDTALKIPHMGWNKLSLRRVLRCCRKQEMNMCTLCTAFMLSHSSKSSLLPYVIMVWK